MMEPPAGIEPPTWRLSTATAPLRTCHRCFLFLRPLLRLTATLPPQALGATSAIKFRLKYPVHVIGSWAYANISGDTDVVLYNSNVTTVLCSKSVDKDQTGAVLGAQEVLFDASANCPGGGVDLVKNTFYFATLKPTPATTIQITTAELGCILGSDRNGTGLPLHHSDR